MSDSNQWRRVRRGQPCPICERPDWCLLAADGSAAICARTESPKRCGEAGCLHRLRDDIPRPRRIVRSIPLAIDGRRQDLAKLDADYRKAEHSARLNALAQSLGLSVASLTELGIGWADRFRAWSF